MERFRDPLSIAAAVLALAVALVGATTSSRWVGEPFPGFLVLENRVIAAAGLTQWPAVAGGEIYQHEIVSMDGRPVERADDLHDYVRSLPVGTEVVYQLRSKAGETELVAATREFGGLDFALLFGSYLFCGLGLTAAGITVRLLRRKDPAARGSGASLWIIGMWALTAVDLYGPYLLFPIHAFLECLLFAATLQLALLFPVTRRLARDHPRIVPSLYLAGTVLGIAVVAGLHDPATYVLLHRVAVAGFGAAMIALIASQLIALVWPESFEARQRVKVLALGTTAALAPQAVLGLTAGAGGQASENLMGWSGVFFPLSIGYAVLRNDLLEVDVILRRTLSYALLTVLVAIGYGVAIAGLDLVFRDGGTASRLQAGFVLAVVSVALLLPLRDRVQSIVDRTFYRTAYDFRRLIEQASRQLASVTDLSVIILEVQTAVAEALQPEEVTFEVRRARDAQLDPAVLAESLGMEIDPADLRERQTVELAGDGLAVPFVAEGRLVALLVLGRRRGGGFYGGEDRRLLHTLANQGAVAIENALALQELFDLNSSLEKRVDARTTELEEAVSHLRAAKHRLVHQEKMASIGQLVAGVAHEINNPLNFIKGNLYLLCEYADGLRGALAAYEDLVKRDATGLMAEIEKLRKEHDIDYIIDDLDSLLASCNEGVERTTTIVRDLRAFSRTDGGVPTTVEVADRIDTTINLLRSHFTGIELERDYADAGEIECLEGQLDQVLMNLLANAADAVEDGGKVAIRAYAADDEHLAIEIEDDGCGIAQEDLDRIFEPFFTTKEVGKGTGLGLAISYGVVARHGGTIAATSEPGQGTCFRIELPRAFQPPEPQEPEPSVVAVVPEPTGETS